MNNFNLFPLISPIKIPLDFKRALGTENFKYP